MFSHKFHTQADPHLLHNHTVLIGLTSANPSQVEPSPGT